MLSERIHGITIGRVWIQFWAMSRYEVRDGKLAVWRDYCDYDLTVATLQGLLGAGTTATPQARFRPPPI